MVRFDRMSRVILSYYLVCVLAFLKAFCVSEHSLTYKCDNINGTINGIIEAAENQITEFELPYEAVCSITCSGVGGERVDWKNLFGNLIIKGPTIELNRVDQHNHTLKFKNRETPAEFRCYIQHDANEIYFQIRFLLPNTMIPNISISIQPYFPIISNAVTVLARNITVNCTSIGFPTAMHEIKFYPHFNDSGPLSFELDYVNISQNIICIANNGIRVSKNILLTSDFGIKRKPSNFSLTSIKDKLILRWQPVSDYLEADTNYSISYSSEQEDDITTLYDIKPTLMDGWYIHELKKLEHCTKYNISIYGYNPGGRGPVHITQNFTLSQKIEEAPKNLNNPTKGTSFLFLTWTQVLENSCDISPITYHLSYYSTNPVLTSSRTIVIERGAINRLESGMLFYILRGLEEFYTYNITLFARNNKGDGPTVNGTYRTKPTAPSSPPVHIELLGKDLVKWNAPPIQYQNGDISNYSVKLEYTLSNNKTTYVSLTATQEFVKIERRPDDVIIRVAVSAYNQVGKGPAGILTIVNDPFRELTEVLDMIGNNTPTVQQSIQLVDESLNVVQTATNKSNTISPRDTSIVVESLSKSLEGISATDSLNRTYFEDFIEVSSIVWKSGVRENEIGSSRPSQVYVDFINVIDKFSVNFAEIEATRVLKSNDSLQCDSVASDNIHSTVCKLENTEKPFQSEFLTIQLGKQVSSLSISKIAITTIAVRADSGYIEDDVIISDIRSINIISSNVSEFFSNDFKSEISFPSENLGEEFSPLCVFFNTSISRWSNEGIETQQQEGVTVCIASHLTSFAVLVVPFETGLTPEQYLALSIVSYILLSLSAIFLAISIVLYIASYKQTLVVEANIVYFNFAIALFLATCTFLFGIQSATNNPVGCFIVALLLHYTWLTVFAWSFCIALLLLYKIWFVLSEKTIWRYLLVIGWIIPAVLVAITAGVANAYYARKGGDHCWLSRDKGLYWAFLGPILLILCVNVFVLVICVVKIYFSLRQFDKDKMRALKVALGSAIVMVPVLNTPWLLLLFTLDKNTYSIILEWIFVFINGSNGIVFFFLFVLRNHEMRKFLKVRCFRCMPSHDTEDSGIARTSNKFSLRKQRTSESYVEQGRLKQDSLDYRISSPKVSIDIQDFPSPIPKSAKKKGGFEALSTEIEEPDLEPFQPDMPEPFQPKKEPDMPEPFQPKKEPDMPEPFQPKIEPDMPEPFQPKIEPDMPEPFQPKKEPDMPEPDPENPVLDDTTAQPEAPQPAAEPIYSTVVKGKKLPKEELAPPATEIIASDDEVEKSAD